MAENDHDGVPMVGDYLKKLSTLGDLDLSPTPAPKTAEEWRSVLAAHATWAESVVNPSAVLAGKRLALPGADLRGVNLSNADLRGADFSEANLAGTNLSGAQLATASFRGANLEGADLSGADLEGADFTDAKGFEP